MQQCKMINANRGTYLALVVLSGLLVGCPGNTAAPAVELVSVAEQSDATQLDTRVLTAEEAAAARSMLRDEIRARTKQAGERELAEWAKVNTVADWQRFRDQRLAALRKSLGSAIAWAGIAGAEDGPARDSARDVVPALVADPNAFEVTGTQSGDGYVIENLVIAGRPGLPITANLYSPDPDGSLAQGKSAARAAKLGPGILLITSHHNGKTQGELLDMGITWARTGASVLVMDNPGYNERRQHSDSFEPREDYRWRYYLGMQLYTVGESLMGWVVDDQRRGIDVLLGHAGADPKRIIVMGSVASGGDAAAVLAAFDKRITCSIPFNFGSNHYASGGDYETTRCLRNGARDGFVPWLIVAAAAPRPLVFAKEFAWDREADAGFARISQVYKLYDAADRLDSIHGYGNGSMSSTQASHASNIGPIHRKGINPILTRWLNMPDPGTKKVTSRPSYESLNCCLTADAKKRFPQRKVYEVVAEVAAKQVAAFRAQLYARPVKQPTTLPYDDTQEQFLAANWQRVLNGGDGRIVDLEPRRMDIRLRQPTTAPAGCAATKILLATDEGIKVPVLLIVPKNVAQPPSAVNAGQTLNDIAGQARPLNGARPPVVLCLSQSGKKTFLARRSKEIAELLRRGVAVCLVDVRGTGETDPPGGKYWVEPIVEIAAEELMTGRTLLGSRLRDVQAVCSFLRSADSGVDGTRLAVWGESFAETNPPGYVDPPLKTKLPNELAEPLGAHLAMLAGLFNPNVKAVLARGGLVSFQSLMDGPACHVALDDIVPGVCSAGDLADVAGIVATRAAVRVEAPVTGRNILAEDQRIKRDYDLAPWIAGQPGRLGISATKSNDAAAWLAESVRGK